VKSDYEPMRFVFSMPDLEAKSATLGLRPPAPSGIAASPSPRATRRNSGCSERRRGRVMDSGTIKIVAALICDEAGRVLLVRKRGTAAFMQPGGKRDPGEDDIAALSREIAEELGCCVVRDSIRPARRVRRHRRQ